MSSELYLISGIIILLVVMYDFFFTTLSGGGAGFITLGTAFVGFKGLQVFVRLIGRKVYAISGMVVNLGVLVVWVSLVWLGLYLVFSSDPAAIIHSNTSRIASDSERLYFTGYVLSTLGMGDYVPTSHHFKLLTSGFSFFGFVFFTTSMTYLISVSSAVIVKRSLALKINYLGKNPDEIIQNLLQTDSSFALQNIHSLQDEISKHMINYHAYPVLQYYGNKTVESSLSINMAALDEAVNSLLFSNKGEHLQRELKLLQNVITGYLKHMKENFSQSMRGRRELNYEFPFPGKDNISKETIDFYRERRSFMNALLKSEHFEWKDVYSNSQT